MTQIQVHEGGSPAASEAVGLEPHPKPRVLAWDERSWKICGCIPVSGDSKLPSKTCFLWVNSFQKETGLLL